MREESSVSNGLTDQWTDDIDLLGYSGACTVCSGIPPFLLLWWSNNFTTLYCPAQHDRSDAKFIINNSFSFYPVHILTWSSFEIHNVFADIAMVLSV